jgi:hypothetical protein
LKVARFPLTNEIVCKLLTALGVTEGVGGSYLLVNTLNPFFPISYDSVRKRFVVSDSELRQRPAAGVSWIGAVVLAACLGARLPFEDDWEDAFAGENVGHRPSLGAPTEFPGLSDIAGDVDEWCLDWFHPDRVYGSSVHSSWLPTEEKVLRGRPWTSPRIRRGKWWRAGTSTTGVRPVWDSELTIDSCPPSDIVRFFLSEYGPRPWLAAHCSMPWAARAVTDP